tara:strand:- start:2504 stop:2707 length:204 start_codon:yes stop_codon:yes gene_type:complete
MGVETGKNDGGVAAVVFVAGAACFGSVGVGDGFGGDTFAEAVALGVLVELAEGKYQVGIHDGLFALF